MNKNMCRLIAFALGFLFGTLCFWMYGFDFDQRGGMAFAWLLASMCSGGFSTLFWIDHCEDK